MCTRTDEPRGSISALVVSLAAALVLVAGVVHDTGRLVQAHSRLADVAGNAARAGAQSVTGIRNGDPRIDQMGARVRAIAMLRTEKVGGTVSVVRGQVRVTVHETVRLTALALLGVASREISVTRSALVMAG
jgi:hypothetical protein